MEKSLYFEDEVFSVCDGFYKNEHLYSVDDATVKSVFYSYWKQQVYPHDDLEVGHLFNVDIALLCFSNLDHTYLLMGDSQNIFWTKDRGNYALFSWEH